jgi:chemotaxis protein MotB
MENDGFEKKERWSVSWSDLMMTMFVLFTALYVYQVGNRELQFGSGPGVNEISENGAQEVLDTTILKSPSDIYDHARQAVMDEFTSASVDVDMVAGNAVRISIAGDLLFDTGQADLLPLAKERLLQVAALLQDNTYIINVVGHTDSMPNHSKKFPTNWELSSARATETVRFLIETAGIGADRFFISAHAWHQPVRPNTSTFNRRMNRRVEIILMKERPFLNLLP